jgi:hypothetical protein
MEKTKTEMMTIRMIKMTYMKEYILAKMLRTLKKRRTKFKKKQKKLKKLLKCTSWA